MNKLIIIIIFLFIGCNNSNEDIIYEEIDFFVDISLLSEKQIIDNSFYFNYPNQLNEVSKEEFNKINESIKNEQNSFLELSLIKAYSSDSNFGILINKIVDKNVFKKIDESDYFEQIKNNFKSSKIDVGKYQHNNIRFNQVIISSDIMVAIKIIIDINESFYQLDYLIPTLVYKDVLKSIESSIGSINKKNN